MRQITSPARPAHRLAALALGLGLSLGLAVAQGATASEPGATRRHELVRMVRQDCGSCHGMQLTGGLGPALTREALADKPLEGLVATIYQGRPGTPMPGWRSMLSEPEAQWIAERLMAGFPQEASR
jgi:cytochrome c55X